MVKNIRSEICVPQWSKILPLQFVTYIGQHINEVPVSYFWAILTRLVEYLVKCSYYTMSTKLEKTSLSGQVYILTRLVEYLVKCSYYTTKIPFGKVLKGIGGSIQLIICKPALMHPALSLLNKPIQTSASNGLKFQFPNILQRLSISLSTAK